MEHSRITTFAGHYGSGKTSLAISYALHLKKTAQQVTLCDLDIVNPYFRTSDAISVLAENGIELIASPFANTNVDAPALPASTRAIFDNPQTLAVIDLGGDDRGALAMGRYAKMLRAEKHEMLLVLNQFRPLTRTLSDLAGIRDEIETASKVPFTGIINNSNLGAHTTLADIRDTLSFAEEASAALSLPLKMTAIHDKLLEGADSGMLSSIKSRTEIFPVTIYTKSIWSI